ncbi:hypothetical protein SAMN04515665_10953 [Blastococcus sp. DSM 46786]|uniref:hypothetical protein n=1 Tax=Blastococcus sp. DSM 46786 TaxID=1798227 RepID=UPI0008ACA6FD|nr:hypothetical protein [Blastococcus sp. DSM 46786]SEL17420.1 hypothetical protein SAMN04515665_10953 [Blastococcus sp. DSM 46786]
MARNAFTASVAGDQTGDQESVVVHVQLRPRRGATRKCLAALAALAAEHEDVVVAVTGLSKDDRVVRVTVGVDLGPRAAVARFSPQAQAAYAFVSALFTSLYDHMPVYTAEPSSAERAAATALLEHAAAGAARADGLPVEVLEALPEASVPVPLVPSPRRPGPGERIPA